MNNNGIKGVCALLTLLLVACLAAACGSNQGAEQVPAVEAKMVEAAEARRQKVAQVSELSGALGAWEESLVAFEVGGRITEMSLKEGDRVSPGGILAGLDASGYSLQVTQAETGVEKAEVAYRQAGDHLERMEQLYSLQAVSKVEYEGARDKFAVAEQDYLQAKQAYALIAGGKDALKAPIGGTVIEKMASVGQLVEPGTPVYRLGVINPLKVLLPVPDKDISYWRTGDRVTLWLYDEKREGVVARVFPATNQGTGTISVEVRIENPKQDWFPGQVVRASRIVAEREGLFVPVEAVLNQGEENPHVFLAVEDKAVKTVVSIGELFDNRLEILSGIEDGDQVIVKGADRLFDGDPVRQAGGAQDD